VLLFNSVIVYSPVLQPAVIATTLTASWLSPVPFILRSLLKAVLLTMYTVTFTSIVDSNPQRRAIGTAILIPRHHLPRLLYADHHHRSASYSTGIQCGMDRSSLEAYAQRSSGPVSSPLSYTVHGAVRTRLAAISAVMK
jgi:hypothetical protein